MKKFDLEAEKKYSLSEIPTLVNITPADTVDSLMRWCTGTSNWSELLTDKKILEVGAGECSFVPRFMEVSKPKRYVATDIFLERMHVAKESINNPIVEFREANILSLPFDENEFDLVLAFGIFHHIPNLEDAVTEITRVLKIGGGLIFRDPWVGNPAIWLKYRFSQKSKNEFPLSGKQIKSVFIKNGFRLIHLSTFWLRFPFLPPGPWSVNIGGFFELVKKNLSYS